MLHINLLGTPAIRWHSTSIDLPRRTVRALLFYLASHTAPVARETLLHVLFGHMPEADARSRLRHSLSQLRQALSAAGVPVAVLHTDATQVYLQDDHCQVDVRILAHAYAASVDQIDAMSTVDFTSLLRGHFLEGVHLPDAVDFEDWLRTTRERMDRWSVAVLLRIGQRQTDDRRWASAKCHAEQALQLDPLCEEACRLLMTCHAALGERSLAVRQYERFRQRLRETLGEEALSPILESHLQQLPRERVAPATDPINASRALSELPLPFVGRERELHQMALCYAQITRPQQSVVFISGVAGQGKTRLVETFLSRLPDEPDKPMVLVATGYPSTQPVPYHIIAEALRNSPSDTLRQHEVLQVLSGSTETTQTGSNLSVVRNAQEARSHAWEHLVTMLEALTQTAPVLLVTHDLQWCDADSLALLTYLCHRAAHLPWLWIATVRDEANPTLQRVYEDLGRLPDERFLQIELPPLQLTEIDQLLQQLHGQPSPMLDLSRHLLNETEGNALFLVETLRGLMADEAATPPVNPWPRLFEALRNREAVGKLPVPAAILKMIETRMALLGPTARQVLSAAAVIGRSFEFDLLRQVCGHSAETVTDALDDLCGQRFLRDNTQRVYFQHGKYQEAVYASLTAARRRLLHARVAEALMTQPDTAGRAFEVIHHAEQGQLWRPNTAQPQAAHWYALAARAARETFATAIAIGHYRAALTALDKAADQRAIDLYAGLGEMLRLQAEYDAAIGAYEAMQRLGVNHGDERAQARAWQGLGLVYNNQGNHAQAIASAERAIELAIPGAAHDIVAAALYDKGWAHFRLGRLVQALECASRVIGISEAQRDEVHLALGHNLLGVTYNLLGDYARAQAALEQALSLFKQMNNLGRMAAILTNLGEVARTRRNHATAIRCNEEALTIARQTGNREMARLCLNNLGGSLVGAGEFGAAEAHLRMAITMIGESRWGGATEVYRLLSEALLGQQRGEEALAAAQTALTLAMAVNRPENIGEAWRALGEAAMQLQRREITLPSLGTQSLTQCFAESARLFRQHHLSVSLLRTLATWATYERWAGNTTQAALLQQEQTQLAAQLQLG